MTPEDLIKMIQNLGLFSKILRTKGLGGRVSDEGGTIASSVEEDSMNEDGYQKLIVEKINVCDCGHVGEIAGRCSNPSCRRALCKDCCYTCSLCGLVYCRECLSLISSRKKEQVCRFCRPRALRNALFKKLLGFKE